MITVHVPAMTARQDVRAISAVISDVPGVRTLRADLATGTTRTGSSGAQTRRHHRSEDVRSTPTLDHSPDTHHCRSRRSS